MRKKVVVILANGFEEIEAITPIDTLRRAGVDVTVVGLTGSVITGAHNITITCDTTLDAIFHQPFDGIVLPGGNPGTTNLSESTKLIEMIYQMNRDNKIIAAICAAPQVLDLSGVLTDKKYTCYPGSEEKIVHGERIDEPVVIDGNIITGRAAGSSLDFSLGIIEELLDAEQSSDISSRLVY